MPIKITTVFVKTINFLLLFLLVTQIVFSQTTFQRKIDIVNNDSPYDIVQTADSGFIISAQSYDYATTTKLSLIKTDKIGNVSWIKSNGSLSNATVRKMRLTSDGGVALFGNYYGGGGTSYGFVAKADNAGSITWSKRIGNGAEDFLSGIQTNDGGYVMAGKTSSYGQKGLLYSSASILSSDLYLVKVNSAGTLQWSKTYGLVKSNEMAFSLCENPDGSLLVVGETTDTTFTRKGYIIKTNAGGDSLWTKTYFNNYHDAYGRYATSFQSIQKTSDGGYVISGMALDSIPSFIDPETYTLLLKIDNAGNIQWNKLFYSTYDYMNVDYYNKSQKSTVYQTPGKGYVIGLESIIAGQYLSCYLIKTDSTGTLEWSRYPGSSFDYGPPVYRSFIPVLKGGYALLGQTYNVLKTPQASGNNNIDMFILKTDTAGKVGTCYNTPITGVYANTMVQGFLPAIRSTGGVVSTLGTGGTAITTFYDSISCMSYPILANFFPAAACIGSSTSIYNNSRGSLFSWDFGDTASGINNTSNLSNPIIAHTYSSVGTYTITLIVTDGDSATSDTTRYLYTLLPDKFISAGTNVTICYGDTTQLNASGALWYYSWQPGTLVRDSTLTNPYTIATSTQTYTISGSNGACYDTNSVTITFLQHPPNVYISANNSVCVGYPTTLSTTTGNRFLWSTGATSASITVVPADFIADPFWKSYPTTYSLTTSYNGTCINDTSITLTVSNRSTPNLLVANTTICEGRSIVLFGSGSSDFIWSPAEGLSDTTVPNPIASPTVSTTYFFITHSGVCSDTAIATIGVVAAPTLSTYTSDISICSGSTTTLSVSGNGTFLWSNGSTATSVVVKPLNSSVFTVEVNNGVCTAKKNLPVAVTAPLIANAGENVSMVCGLSTTLSGTGGSTFAWSPETGLSSTNNGTTIFQPLVPGIYTYSLTVSTGTGCVSAPDAVVVTVSNVKANAGQDISICAGSITKLSGSGGMTYTWTPETGISSTNTGETSFNLSGSGNYTYSLVVASGVGCVSGPDEVTVTVIAVPTVDAGIDITLPQNTSDTLLASGNALSYSWSPALCSNCLDPIVGPFSVTTQYILTADNGNNCTATDTVTVFFKPLPCEIFVANAFSPNNDANNDSLKVNSKCIDPKDFDFRIYDRWGTLVFESFEQDKAWDGKFLNQNLPGGSVYIYTLTGKSIYKDTIDKKGNISILR